MVTTDFRVLKSKESESPETYGEDYKKALETLGMENMSRFETEGGIIPYQRITQELGRAFNILFDGRSNLEQYQHDQPPMEALGCMVFAKMAGYFDEIHIRYSNKDKDPVAIGVVGKDSYLICGWAEDNLTIEGFVQKAREIYLSKFPPKIRQKVVNAKAEIAKYENALIDQTVMQTIAEESFEHELQYGYSGI